MTETVELKHAQCDAAMDGALKFVQPSLKAMKTEKGLVGIFCHAFRAGWAASTRSDPAVRDRSAMLAAIKALPRSVMEVHDNNGDVFVSLRSVLAAISTSPPEPASRWMSMDSAPKDGRPVLLAFWRGAGAKGVTTGSYGVNGHDQWTTAGNRSLNSFAWQPLPTPPAKEPQ